MFEPTSFPLNTLLDMSYAMLFLNHAVMGCFLAMAQMVNYWFALEKKTVDGG